MDYILGKNATGYCYVTGFGMKSPLYPHHRLSASDDIEAPLPGFLVGGPNLANKTVYPILPICRMSLMQMWKVRMLPMK